MKRIVPNFHWGRRKLPKKIDGVDLRNFEECCYLECQYCLTPDGKVWLPGCSHEGQVNIRLKSEGRRRRRWNREMIRWTKSVNRRARRMGCAGH